VTRKSKRPQSARLRVESLEDRTVPSSPPVRFSFFGPDDRTTTPPSPSIAVGPTHAVYVTNNQIEWRTAPSPTAGPAAGSVTTTSFSSFFSSSGPYTSPKVVYDQFANRFVFAVIENTGANSRLLIAVSDDSNPANGTWFKQSQANTVNFSGNDTFASQLNLAVDDEAVYITTTQNRFSGGAYEDARVRIMPKGLGTGGWYENGTPVAIPLLDPDPSNSTLYEGLAPAHIYGTQPGGTIGTYLVAYNGAQIGPGPNDSIQVVRINNPLSVTPTFTATTINLPVDIDQGGALPDANQPGTAVNIDTGDRRVGNAVWQNDSLYFGATINPAIGTAPPADVGEATAHWFKVSTTGTPTLADQGNVDSSVVANMSTFMPAVAVDRNGNMAVSFAGTGEVFGQNPESLGAFFATRRAGDPAGFLDGRTVVTPSVNPYDVDAGTGVSPWGPYTALTVDPTSQYFWNFAILADVPSGSPTDPGLWQAVGASFSYNNPPDLVLPLPDPMPLDEDSAPFTLPSFDLNFQDFESPDSDLTYSVVSNNNVSLGTVDFVAREFMRFSPAANAFGSADIRIRATDPDGGFTEDTLTITITPVEDTPIAVDDSYSTDEEVTLNVNSINGLLSNDSDPDPFQTETLAAFRLTNTPPNTGSVTVQANGSFVFTPQTNFSGVTSFTYEVRDQTGRTDTGTVFITVNPVNDPPQAANDPDTGVSYTTLEDTTLVVPVAIGVLNNDSDPDGVFPAVPGDVLEAVLLTGPQHDVAFTLFPDGSFTYTPEANFPVTANFAGIFTDTFTYRVFDGTEFSAPATVTITVTPVDDAPVANNDTYPVDEDDLLTLNAASGILSNDDEFDGQPLTLTKLTDPVNGVLVLQADGSLTYQPNLNFSGTDSFTYKVSDGTTDSLAATVTFNVLPINDDPIATGDGPYTVLEDTLLSVAAPGILANDTDVDLNTLTVDVVSPPAHFLTFTANPDGSFDYQAAANYFGADSFTYRVFDGTSFSNTVTVSLVVTPVQDRVVAFDDVAATAGKPIRINVLANDVDPDRDPLRVVSYTKPAFGRVTRSGSALVYTPNKGATGLDTFTYVVTDGRGNKDTGEVQVTITDGIAPTVTNIRVYYGPTRYVDLPTTRPVLPWDGITKISVVFSEDIQSGPLANALTLTGFNGSALPLTFDSFDAATNTASWNLGAAIGNDRISLKIDRTDILDIAGNMLAKDAGRNFVVLPGDFDGNGVVNDIDLKAIKSRIGKPNMSNRFADIDGNGFIDQVDLDKATLKKGTRKV